MKTETPNGKVYQEVPVALEHLQYAANDVAILRLLVEKLWVPQIPLIGSVPIMWGDQMITSAYPHAILDWDEKNVDWAVLSENYVATPLPRCWIQEMLPAIALGLSYRTLGSMQHLTIDTDIAVDVGSGNSDNDCIWSVTLFWIDVSQ